MEKCIWIKSNPMHRSILLFSALFCLWGSSASSSPKTPVVALVRPVKSPLLKELGDLGPFVRPRDPLASLLVVDGDSHSGTMAENTLLRKAWEAGKALLILDADEGDLKGDLIRLTGVVPSTKEAGVYLRKRQDGGVDLVLLSVKGTSNGHAGRLRRQDFLRRVLIAFRDELPVSIHRTAEGKSANVQSASASNTAFQLGPYAISASESEDLTASWGYANPLSPWQSVPLPTETATVNFTDTVMVVGTGSYGNPSQYPPTAFIAYAGNALPSGGNSWVQSFNQITIPSTQVNAKNLINGYVNPQQQRTIELALDQGTPTLVSAEPVNTAGEVQVTSGIDIGIGVGPEGPSGSVGYNSSQTTSIEGWSVTQTQSSTGSEVNWVYQEQLDSNGNDMTDIYSDLFANNSAFMPGFGVYVPSVLATSRVQSAPAAVWSTQEQDGAQSADIGSRITSANTYWVRYDPFIGTSNASWYLGTVSNGNVVSNLGATATKQLTILLTDLWNQMGYLSSVSVPATVSGGTQMAVTVTLDHAAPQRGMPVTLTTNAPGIIPPQSTLSVPAGMQSFTFQIPVMEGGSGEVTLTFWVNGLPMYATTTVE